MPGLYREDRRRPRQPVARRRAAADACADNAPVTHSAPTPTRALAYASLGLSMTLVGSYVALSKPLVAAMPVFLLAWLRFGLGGLASLHWLRRPADEPALDRRTRGLLFLESFLGNFLFTVCMLYGVRYAGAATAGVVMALIPAAVALLSHLALGERMGRRTLVAVGLTVLGVALFSLQKSELSTQSLPTLAPVFIFSPWAWGVLLLVGAVGCEASYAVIGKRLSASLSPRRITALINLWGLALMTPLGWMAARGFDWTGVRPAIWALLVFYAMAASVWSVALWMHGLRAVPASQAGVFTVMLPLSATLTGVLVLGERLQPGQWLAFGLCLLGLLLATAPLEALRRAVDRR